MNQLNSLRKVKELAEATTLATFQTQIEQFENIKSKPSCARLRTFIARQGITEMRLQAQGQLESWLAPTFIWRDVKTHVCAASTPEAKARAVKICSDWQAEENARDKRIDFGETGAGCVDFKCSVEVKIYVNADCH